MTTLATSLLQEHALNHSLDFCAHHQLDWPSFDFSFHLYNNWPAPIPQVMVGVSEVGQGAGLPCTVAPPVPDMFVQRLNWGEIFHIFSSKVLRLRSKLRRIFEFAALASDPSSDWSPRP